MQPQVDTKPSNGKVKWTSEEWSLIASKVPEVYLESGYDDILPKLAEEAARRVLPQDRQRTGLPSVPVSFVRQVDSLMQKTRQAIFKDLPVDLALYELLRHPKLSEIINKAKYNIEKGLTEASATLVIGVTKAQWQNMVRTDNKGTSEFSVWFNDSTERVASWSAPLRNVVLYLPNCSPALKSETEFLASQNQATLVRVNGTTELVKALAGIKSKLLHG